MTNGKSSYEKLVSTSEGRRMLEQELLLVSATDLIADLLQERMVSRAELARRIGKTKAFVTQILRGRHNMTLRTLADLASALEARVHLRSAAWDIELHMPVRSAPWHESWTLPKSVLGIPPARRAPINVQVGAA